MSKTFMPSSYATSCAPVEKAKHASKLMLYSFFAIASSSRIAQYKFTASDFPMSRQFERLRSDARAASLCCRVTSLSEIVVVLALLAMVVRIDTTRKTNTDTYPLRSKRTTILDANGAQGVSTGAMLVFSQGKAPSSGRDARTALHSVRNTVSAKSFADRLRRKIIMKKDLRYVPALVSY